MQARLQIQQARAPLGKLVLCQSRHAGLGLGKALVTAIQARLRTLLGKPCQQMVVALACGLQQAPHALVQAAKIVLQPPVDLPGIRNQQFGSCRRGSRTQIGDEVGDGKIHLVADCRHQRYGIACDGARDAFVVESPEVLQ